MRIAQDSTFEERPLLEPLPPDTDWVTQARIWLRPKTSLSIPQAEVVRREFGFDGELLSVTTRKALEFFLDRRWGLSEPGARLEWVKTDYTPLGTDH
jgi:hypothetical protein